MHFVGLSVVSWLSLVQGMNNTEFISAKHVKEICQYKNVRVKLHRTKAVVCFNKMCRQRSWGFERTIVVLNIWEQCNAFSLTECSERTIQNFVLFSEHFWQQIQNMPNVNLTARIVRYLSYQVTSELHWNPLLLGPRNLCTCFIVPFIAANYLLLRTYN
jgi:hypothetical protein